MHSSAFSSSMSHTETTWNQAHNTCCIFSLIVPKMSPQNNCKAPLHKQAIINRIINRKACTRWEQFQKCEYLHNSSCKWKEIRKAQVPDSPLWNRCNSWQSQGKLYLFLVELNPILNDRIKTKHFLPAKPRLQYGQQWSAGNASDFLACILICLSEQSLGPAIGKWKWGWCWGCLKSILNDFQLPCFLCSLLYCTLKFYMVPLPTATQPLVRFSQTQS